MKSSNQDEEYLISRAKRREEGRVLSKSWLITARVMFPGNFNIQYEAYSMMKDDENVTEAAKAFQELFKEFVRRENVDKLWQELGTVQNKLNKLSTITIFGHFIMQCSVFTKKGSDIDYEFCSYMY